MAALWLLVMTCLLLFITPNGEEETTQVTSTTILTTAAVTTKYITSTAPTTEEETTQPTYYTMTVIVSAYCNEKYPHICNNGYPYITATGTQPKVGRTIAVDPDMIPLGTKVEIDGIIYIAEDTGGSIIGNRIDLLLETHEQALQWGMQQKTIKVYY